MNQVLLASRVAVARPLFVVWMLLLLSSGLQARELPPIQLRLYVAPNVDPRPVDRAQSIVRTIFETAGLQIEWLDCSAGTDDAACTLPLAPAEFLVRVLPLRADRDSPACGVTVRPRHGLGSRLTTLYAACMRDVADRLYMDPAVIIAYTLAHEIGHLLLPDDRHGSSGVMRGSLAQPDAAEWRRAARGDLRFSETELKLMKEGLANQAARQY